VPGGWGGLAREGGDLNGYEAYLGAVNAVEADMRARTDGELRALTEVFRRRLGDGESLDDLLAEGFAAVREAARRTLFQRHYDAQVIAGVAVHSGNLAEMPAGEGKTLAVTLPAYLNALAGGVHVVTANDHLAGRDAGRVGVIYRFLGLDIGVIVAEVTDGQRQRAYAADVVYGTALEFGYDYLRDNLAWSLAECVQRGHKFVIVDDADSGLLDLGATPLLIDGPGPVTLATITVGSFLRLYDKLGGLTTAARSEAASYREMYGLEVIDIPARRPVIRLDRPDIVYRTTQARATVIADVISEMRAAGRPVLVGAVAVEDAQHLSRLLDRRGIAHSLLTAEDHEQEAHVIAQAGRQGAVTLACVAAGRGVDPALGGNAEYRAEQELRTAGMIPGADPAAWDRARLEAIAGHSLEVVAGHDAVAALGGLCVIGIGRHESRRLDDLRRGWAGRRGEPGESRVYIAVEELTAQDLSADEVLRLVSSVPIEDGTESPSFARIYDEAQRVLEQHDTESRILIYRFAAIDDAHRFIVYAQRRRVLERTRLEENVQEMIDEVITSCIQEAVADKGRRRELRKSLARLYPISPAVSDFAGNSKRLPAQLITDRVRADAHAAYSRREQELTPGVMRELEQRVLLNVIDHKWRDHLTKSSALKDKIWHSNLDTATMLAEYQRQSHQLLERAIADIKQEAVSCLFNLDVEVTQAAEDTNDHQ
jgi:preprotein translocase subunit SecA